MSNSLKDHFLEACIRDYDARNPQSATSTMLSTLIFYCEGALEVNECKFEGFLDFCAPKDEQEEEANLMIFIFAGAGGFLLILIIIIIICWKKKKQKKKQVVEGLLVDADGFTTLNGGAHSNPLAEDETSFVEGKSSMHGGRRVSSIGSSLFDYNGTGQNAPPDRVVYNPRSLSRSTSVGSSRLSGSNSSIDIMVSPTPDPADNRSVTATSPDSAFARGRVSSNPNFAPTPSEFSNVPAPVGTSVMRSRPSMPNIRETGNFPRIPPPPGGRTSDLRMGAGPKAPWSEEGRLGISPTPTPGNISVKLLWNSLVNTMKDTPTPGPITPGPGSPGPNLAGAFAEEDDVFTPEPTTEV